MKTCPRVRKTFHVLSLLLIATALVFSGGCSRGGGGGVAVTPEDVKEGYLLDGPVEGMEYVTVLWSGITDRDGKFLYQDGENITFFLGDVILGRTNAKRFITPLDIVAGSVNTSFPEVINMSRLLQSLDFDGDLDNGIQISSEIREALTGVYVDFTDPNFAENQNVQLLFDKLNSMDIFPEGEERGLVSAEDAQIHLEETLAVIEAEESRPPRELPLTGFILAPLGNVIMYENQAMNFQASVYGGTPPYQYQWKLDRGGTFSTEEDPGFLTFSPGSYTVLFTAMDAEGDTVSDLRKMDIRYQELDGEIPPSDVLVVAFITSTRDATISLGETLDLTAEIVQGNPPFRYYWVINGQKNYSYLLEQKAVEFTTPGEHEISFFIRDVEGDDWIDRVTITVTE